mgnify:CR=1 FL=1
MLRPSSEVFPQLRFESWSPQQQAVLGLAQVYTCVHSKVKKGRSTMFSRLSGRVWKRPVESHILRTSRNSTADSHRHCRESDVDDRLCPLHVPRCGRAVPGDGKARAWAVRAPRADGHAKDGATWARGCAHRTSPGPATTSTSLRVRERPIRR